MFYVFNYNVVSDVRKNKKNSHSSENYNILNICIVELV